MKDLVLEAVKAFPVWPDGAVSVFLDRNWRWHIRNELKMVGALDVTREQHIRKRIELFENYRPSMGSVMLPNVTLEELNYIAEIDNKNKGLDYVTDTDVGEWVPEVGQKALLLNEGDYRIDYGEHVVGEEVTVLSIFENSSGVAVAAVEFEENGYCFRVSMLHEPKTEAEKERELLEEKMYRDAQLADCVNFTKGMAKALIAAGWRPSYD